VGVFDHRGEPRSNEKAQATQNDTGGRPQKSRGSFGSQGGRRHDLTKKKVKNRPPLQKKAYGEGGGGLQRQSARRAMANREVGVLAEGHRENAKKKEAKPEKIRESRTETSLKHHCFEKCPLPGANFKEKKR